MTVDRTPNATAEPPAATRGDVLLDGLLTGMIGAIAVALWFLILDLVDGHPLFTPALLGSFLQAAGGAKRHRPPQRLHGAEAAGKTVTIAPLEIAAYTAFHFMAFAVVGVLFSYLMTLFERFPIMFFVMLVLFLSLQIGFYCLNVALGTSLLGKLPAWTVVVGNLLAAAGMVGYQWRRHPGVIRGIERLWQADTD